MLLVAIGVLALVTVRVPQAAAAGALPFSLNGVNGATRVIAVIGDSWSSQTATMTMWQKRRDGAWVAAGGPWRVWVGKNGWAPSGHKVEGDGRTPVGSYTFGVGFGTAANPGYGGPWVHLSDDLWWDETPGTAAYNSMQRSPPYRPGRNDEHLARVPQYSAAALINYNTNPVVQGAGSAIFLHDDPAGYSYTAGCIGVPGGHIGAALRFVQPGTTRIIMGPAAAVTHGALDPIAEAYDQMGGASGVLGAPTAAATADGIGGSFATYSHGAIYDNASVSSLAHEVHGAIAPLYARMGAARSVLGYPTTNQWGTADGGQYNLFQHGAIFFTGDTGAHEVHGAIASLWSALGWDRSVLGYPTSDQQAVGDDAGSFNTFQHGTIYWSPATGAHAVPTAMLGAFDSAGGPRGALGYPTSEVALVPGAYVQDFQHGTILATGSGSHVLFDGPLRDRYALAGGPGGALGPPTSDQTSSGHVERASFAHGAIVVDPGAKTSTISYANGTVDRATHLLRVAAYVDGSYRALLGRAADASGAATWSNVLYRYRPRASFTDALVHSTEARDRQVAALYRDALGRGVDASGRITWRNAIAAHSWVWAAGRIYGSQEWFDRAGGTNATFVAALYQAVLGRPSDPSGQASWTAQLNAGTPRPTMATQFLESTEYARSVAANAYLQVLGRTGDQGGIRSWAIWLQARGVNGSFLAAHLAASTEFVDTHA